MAPTPRISAKPLAPGQSTIISTISSTLSVARPAPTPPTLRTGLKP